jgi:hypothetical protein
VQREGDHVGQLVGGRRVGGFLGLVFYLVDQSLRDF